MSELNIGSEIELFGHKGIILDIWGAEWRKREGKQPDYIIYCYKCEKFHATMTGHISGCIFIENYDSSYQGYQEMQKRLSNLGVKAQ